MGQIKLPKKIDLKLNLRNVQKTACELSLSAFIKRAWHIIEPAQLYVHGWHIDFLCAHLEAITEGKVLDNGEIYNRLLINIPPGPGWVENLVMTDKGRVRLGDIKPGDMVLTHKGRFRNVSACYSKGRLDTLVVKTRSGREMVLTPDHNVLTPDGWVEARHLVIGSTLAVVTPETGLANEFDSVLMEDPVVEILPGGERECMCISVDEDHSLTWSDIAVHNTMKSLCTSVFWPAWEWGPKNMPNLRYVCVSHSQDLAIRDNIRMRRLVESDWYQDLWPHVQMVSDQNAKTKFETTATGFRQAVAAGSITGARGDRVIIDDPLSVEDAASEQIRKTREDWFLESVPSRLNNPISSAIIVIMQRLHESDTSGLILDRQLGYDHICLPMRFVSWRKEFPTKLGYVDPREVEGELLFPDRFPQSVVDRDERIMGIYATAGQNQQEPVPRGGGIIERDWWRVYQSEDNAYPAFDYIVAALDTAYGEKQHEGDFSALTVWGVFTSDLTAQVTKTVGANGMMTVERSYSDQQTPKVMLIYAYNKRAPFHQLLQDTADICTKFQVDRVLVENKASGLSILQELRRVYGHEPWAIEAVNPEVDKIARLYSVSSLFSDGLVYASTKEWAEQVILQTCNFPKSKNDDLVDTVSMALRHLRKIGILQRSAERVAELESMKQYTGGAPAPLYAV